MPSRSLVEGWRSEVGGKPVLQDARATLDSSAVRNSSSTRRKIWLAIATTEDMIQRLISSTAERFS